MALYDPLIPPSFSSSACILHTLCHVLYQSLGDVFILHLLSFLFLSTIFVPRLSFSIAYSHSLLCLVVAIVFFITLLFHHLRPPCSIFHPPYFSRHTPSFSAIVICVLLIYLIAEEDMDHLPPALLLTHPQSLPYPLLSVILPLSLMIFHASLRHLPLNYIA